jgi:hypothetical protein
MLMRKCPIQINNLKEWDNLSGLFPVMALTLTIKTKPLIMKKVFLIIAIVSGIIAIQPARAQVHLNIVAQPIWGPVGYDYVEYYYLPDIETYYYVPGHQYVYLNNGRWVYVTALPARYRAYNLYNGYKVVINEPRPYLKFKTHKITYAKYKGNNGRQVIIRNSNDPKYFVIKGHPKYKAVTKSKPVVHSKNNSPASVKNTSKPTGRPIVKNNAKSNAKGKGKQ